MHRCVKTQYDLQVVLGQWPGIEFIDCLVDVVQDRYGVRAVLALHGNVVSREARAVHETATRVQLRRDVGDLAQAYWLVVWPGNNQLAELVEIEAPKKAYGVLTPANAGEPTG